MIACTRRIATAAAVRDDRPRRYPHPIIAREGWPFLAIALVVAVALSLASWWLLAIARVDRRSCSSLQFFRDPPRDVPAQPNAVLSPADGRVVAVGKARDPYLDRDALKISVFMNVFNVHSNRSPVDATVARARGITPGSFVNAALDKASLDNERNALKLAHADGRRRHLRADRRPDRAPHPLLCRSAAIALARGQRYGFIRFGSRVDLYLPPDADAARGGRRQGVRDRRRSSPSCRADGRWATH